MQKNKNKAVQEIIEENNSTIKFLKNLLLVIAISIVVAVVSLMFAFSIDATFFWVLFFISLLCAGLVSWYCASLTGHEMVGLDKLGLNTMEGCLTSIIYMPLYFIMFWYYTLVGWVFVLMAIAEFKKENERLMEKS
jgi:hypothetical protein